MGHRLLPASDQHWRPSNAMGVANTDLAWRYPDGVQAMPSELGGGTS